MDELSSSDVGASAAVDPARARAVDKARQAWISRLIDLSQRNNLLYFRSLKVGTLDLTLSDRDRVADLLSGKTVPLSQLLPEIDRVKLLAQAKEIARKAKENMEERGLETLHLAAGMATWQAEEGKRAPMSAVLLVPVALDVRGRAGPSLKRSGEPQVNPVLLHVLATSYRCALSPEVLLQAADTDPDRDDDPFDLDALLARLVELAHGVPEFGVRRTVILGNFAFQKMAMVRDLNELGAQLAGSDLIAGLAGDVGARSRVNPNIAEPDPRQFDQISPQTEFLVLDTDSSQQKTIRLARQGQSIVIQGPPGTGKSQVIANLIVVLAAQGKRVLFVAEKRAALQVVLDRLKRCGLDNLALDLHGADTSRKLIAGRLRSALENVSKGEPACRDGMLQVFQGRRESLNEHVEQMHAKRPPSGLSVFELQARLLHAAGGARCKTRFRGPELMKLSVEAIRQGKDALTSAGAMAELFLRVSPSPWSKAQLPDGHAAQAAIDLVNQLIETDWPEAKKTFEQVLAPVHAPTVSAAEAQSLLELCVECNELLAVVKPTLFQENLDLLAAALEPAAGGWLSRMCANVFSGRYRRAKKATAGHLVAPLPPGGMLEKVKRAQSLTARWKSLGFTPPAPVHVEGAEQARPLSQQLVADLQTLGQAIDHRDLPALPIAELEALLGQLRDDPATARRIPALRETESRLTNQGLDRFVEELRQTRPAAESWPASLEFAWLVSCLEAAWADDPQLAGFSGQVQNKVVADFCQLDRDRLKLAGLSVAKRHVQEAGKMLTGLLQQSSIVRREAEKKTRHLPFRKLIEQAPDVLAALFPCFMCSPLSVSQLLPGDGNLFDVVVFDEASQVLPEDAVASLVRGRQAIVAGDEHQLPPTQFFAGHDDDDDPAEADDAPEAAEGFESLLSMMKAFVPSPMLEWHYRSRDERLIAFSNQHIYSGRLVTFPSPGSSQSAVEHVLVDGRTNASGDDDSASPEVRRVVEMILEHAKTELPKPPEQRRSLGVIALGITHTRRVESALDAALEDHPDLEAFFDPNLPERFFIKNLERVQGDERDVIFLTLGVAPDKAGRVSLTRFGPLNNREQGYRRLNVAITRARSRMVIISSFTHHGIDVSGELSRGMELLRQYLQFASAGGIMPDGGERTEVSSNLFEADVADALAGAGIHTVPQWGASRYRIDLVAQHPTRPGRLVLAIECDGASYHSAPTARDRDRLRQQHLEALGWRFHRIWSTDWFTRRDDEIRRARSAFDQAVEQANKIDGQASAQTTSSVTTPA